MNCICFGLELRGVEADRGLLNLFSILFNKFAGLAMPVLYSACLHSLPRSSTVVFVDPLKLVSDPQMVSLLDRLRNVMFLHVQVPAP